MHSQMEYKVHGNKFERLQAKIRKSEMERQELECRFQNLMRSSNECEKSSLKLLREEYKKFMDEDKQRVERNENLLQTLDRIDFQAAALAAKTERLKLLKTQYKSLLVKNWAGDGGSRLVSHRSNVSSPQEYHHHQPPRYARMSPIYQNHGQNYWSDGEMGSVKNAPQIRDMEIQTSLSMLDTPHAASFLSTMAPSKITREPPAPLEGNQDAKLSGSAANQMESPEYDLKEVPPVSPEWNRALPVVTSTITTSQSDYLPSSSVKWDEVHEVETKDAEDEQLVGENTPKPSFASPEDPPHESFYLRDMVAAPESSEDVNDRRIEEYGTPEHQEASEEVAQEETIDSGQSEMGEQLGNLSTTATPKPRTSFLRHALLKNTKHELIGRGRGGGDKGTPKVVKRVEFCLDQNESHEDTKSQWNLDEIRETPPSHHDEMEDTEETQEEPLAEERSLMSPHYSQYVGSYEPTQGEEELNQFDDEYERDELESETQEEPSYADTHNIHEESIEAGEILQHQVDYAAEESTIDPQTTNYQYEEMNQDVVEPYYAESEDNVQMVVDENAYVSEAPFAVHGSYVQDNSEMPQSEAPSSTPSVHLLTQDHTVEQPESPYQQFISPDANVQPDTYQDGGFTASSDYVEGPQQQMPQDFGSNEVYTGSEYQQYDASAINQVVEYDGYDTMSAPPQPEGYNLNQGVMGYEQNYANYDTQDVQYPPDGTIQGYDQGYSDANYAEAAGRYIGADEVREYEQGRDGVYLSEAPPPPSEQVEVQQMYANFQQGDQYGSQQEIPGDYYNLSGEVVPPNQDTDTLQALQIESTNQEVTSPQTTYSDDSNYPTQELPLAEPPPPRSENPKSTNFLDSSSSESERRPGQKVKFADEEKHFPTNDESDFDFSSQRDDK